MHEIAFLAVFCLQQEPVDTVIRHLQSENVQEREKAEMELRRRGESAMEALEKAQQQASDPAEKARLRRALEEILGYRPVTLERIKAVHLKWAAATMKLRQAAGELSRLSEIPVEVDGPPGTDPTVDFPTADVPMERLLDALARQSGGMWLLDGRRILIFVAGKGPLRLFDVRDLTTPVLDDPWIRLEPDESDALGLDDGSGAPFTGEDLAHILQAEVAHESWQEEGFYINYLNGLLVASNTAETLKALESQVEKHRRQSLAEIKIEVEAYAVKPGTRVEEAGIERFREAAAEGKAARRLVSFERTLRDKRRAGLASLSRVLLLTGYDGTGTPQTAPLATGVRANLRASLDDERTSVRVDLDSSFSRLLLIEKRKDKSGDVQVPTVATHNLHLSIGVPAGQFVVLGRLGETRIVEGLGEIVLIGRFTAMTRR